MKAAQTWKGIFAQSAEATQFWDLVQKTPRRLVCHWKRSVQRSEKNRNWRMSGMWRQFSFSDAEINEIGVYGMMSRDIAGLPRCGVALHTTPIAVRKRRKRLLSRALVRPSAT
jgi:hypothetical protein